MKFLVTGAAGFIGSHVSKRLLDAGHQVVGIDNLNDYYDVNLKLARLDLLKSANFSFHKLDLADREGMAALFTDEKFDRVIHPPLRQGFATRWIIPMLMRMPTRWVILTCWKAVATIRFNTCFTPLPAPFMGSTVRCLSLRTIQWITLFHCMRQPKGQ